MNQNTPAFENPDNQNDQRLHKEQPLNNELTRKNFSINNSPPFLDIIPQMVSYTNKDLQYEYANKAYEQYFNLRASEIIGRNLVDIIGEKVLQKAKNHINKVLDGEEVKYLEKFDYPEGMTRYIEGHLIPDIDKSGNAKGYWAILNDVTDKYEAEKRLKENEEKYRFLYDNSPLPYQSLDEYGRILEVNATWLSTLGYEKKEVIGKHFTEFLHPDYHIVFKQKFPVFIAHGYVHDYQFKIKHNLGHYLDVSYEGRIEYGPDGNVRQTNCIFKDITEQKHIEEAYRTLVKNSFQGLVIMQDEKVVFANSAIASITGYSIEELYSKSWQSIVGIVHKDDMGRVMHKLNKLVQGNEKAQHNSFRIIHKNGSIRWVEVFSSLINYKANPAIQVAYIDITDRKKAEEALKESMLRYEKLLEESPAGIVLFVNNKPELINNKLLEITGYSSFEEFKSNTLYDIIHPGDHFMIRSRLEAIQEGTISYPLSSTYRIIRKDGTIRHIAEFSSQFFIHNKTYTQSIIQDITDIIETEKSKRRLAGEAAHVERKLQLLKQVESSLKRVIEENRYEMDQFAPVLDLIKNEIEFDRHWQIFKENFESIHAGFFRKLTSLSPKLTQQDIKHCALIKMNFETKEIAAMFNIKPSSVQISRVRLKKKLGLPPEEDLIRYILNL